MVCKDIKRLIMSFLRNPKAVVHMELIAPREYIANCRARRLTYIINSRKHRYRTWTF